MDYKEGIIASRGMAIGTAYLFEKEDIEIDDSKISDEEVNEEIKRVNNAIEEYSKELEETELDTETQQQVINAHLEMLQDPFLVNTIIEKIKNNMNAEMALDSTINDMANMLEALEDEYMKERAADYKDIGSRIMYKLKNIEPSSLNDLPKNSIIVSKELTPSDTSNMDINNVSGMLMDLGGATGHTSIIAQTLGIPTMVGMEDISHSVKNGDKIVIDSNKGRVYINPNKELLNKYEEKIYKQKENQARFDKGKFDRATTKDGHSVEIACNMGSISDLEAGIENGAEGVGLFRTEFLYMDNTDFPTEEEQFQVYKEAALMLKDKPLIIRTLDIGGDKSLPYYKFPEEENPFLGWRAIRVSFDLPEVMNAQLRAMLRASAYGNVKILLPMIISVEELIKFNNILEDNKNDLKNEGIKFNEDIDVGIMIETPASVIMAEELIKHADYFSIGTNDLTQYTLAVDRGNQVISDLYTNYHPAVLKSIKKVIDISHKAGKWTGMCGGFASDTNATKLLLGMGLDEFSAAGANIPEIKDIIRNTEFKEAKEFADNVLNLGSTEDIKKYIKENN